MLRVHYISLLLLGMLLSSTAVMARSSNLPDFTTMVEDVSPAVVNISASREVRQSSRRSIMEEFFGRGNPNRGDQPRRAESEGSGFIISDDGYVLTNKHVVEDADEVIVRIPDGREYTAKVIGEDEGTDVALLKIEADEKLPVLPTGDSDKLKVGEWVLGFGAPFGFDQTVTAGIVSAKRRTLLGREQYVPFIQTDVAINPGNSGGPLVSMDGKVVGINSQILSRDGGYLGISFAIPIETALHVANQFKRYDGQVKRGFLGVQYQDVTYKMAKTFGMDKVEGALLTMVTRGSAADEAGLQSGDIIVKLDGKYIRRAGELPFVVGLIEPGTEVRVEYVREGDRKKTKLTVGEREDPTRVAASESDPDNSLLGMVVEDMSEDMRRSSDVTGIVVRGVSPDGPAARADIRRGDILVSIARQQVESVAQFNELVEDLPRGEPIPALVVRANGLPTFVSINIPEE